MITPARILAALRQLPPPIVEDVCATPFDALDAGEICEPETMLEISKRLVLTTGLLASARYCSSLRADPEQRHTRLDHSVAAILQKTYSLGIASTIMMHGATAQNADAEQDCEEGLRRLLALAEMSPGNFWRALPHISVTEVLLQTIDAALRVTRDVAFADDKVTCAGEPLDVWPFLLWNDKQLDGLREIRWRYSADGLPTKPLAMFIAESQRDDTVTNEIEFDVASERRILAILDLLGVEIGAAASRARSHSESFVPLFWASHQKMDELVELLVNKSDVSTKHLWLEDYLLQHTTDESITFKVLEEALANPVIVANSILWRCITKDPLSVLIDFFTREPDDIPYSLSRWRAGEATTIANSIQRRADAFQARKRALWVRSSDDLKLVRTAEQARLAAIEVARGIGFPVREMSLRPSVEGYLVQLEEFIGAMLRRPDPSRIIGALVETAKICEDVLQFVIRFYNLLAYYDPSVASGLPPGIGMQRGRPATLGPLIEAFAATCERLEGRAKRSEPLTGARRGLTKPCREKTSRLGEFLTWRNDSLHLRDDARVLPFERQIQLLENVLDFLLFTLSPDEGRPSEVARIAPAVLQLNLVTANRCGITTVTYKLTQEGNSPVITLYTRQPVAAAAGVFYGVPRQDRSTRELWVDPVLFAAEEFERAVGGSA